MTAWTPLTVPPSEGLVDTRIQLHFAAQLLASVGNALAEPRDDASHRAFAYRPELDAMVGVPVAGDSFRAALHLPTGELQLLDESDGVIEALPLTGTTTKAALAWINETAASRLAEPQTVVEHRYDSDFPEHAVGGGAPYAFDLAHAAELNRYYMNMHAQLERIRPAHPTMATARVWPHHFDLAALIDRGEGRTIGVGLSPGDFVHLDPYFYVSPYPFPDADRLPASDGPGAWRAEPWFGASLTATQLLAVGDDRQACVEDFLDHAVRTSAALLGDATSG